MVMYGSRDFVARHNEILSTFYKGTTKRHRVRRVRFVTADVAIVDIDNEVHGVKAMPAGIAVSADGIVRTQLMEVFVRRGGQWEIEAYHKSTSSRRPGHRQPCTRRGTLSAVGSGLKTRPYTNWRRSDEGDRVLPWSGIPERR